MIHALPGMGADRRMYPAPWNRIPGFVAHDWIRHGGQRSLAEVAETMTKSCGIKDGDNLVGSSLGGMVACEITKLRRIRRLYLVGSAIQKEEVNRLLATLSPLAQFAPIEWLRISAARIPTEFSQMFAGLEPPFIRAMCAAIFQWPGAASPQTRVFRLHGKHDLVIPPPAQVDLLVDGGHLISITHPEPCVRFVEEKQG